jgi:raffinose/stachyose/melibiose transport system permease protein
MAGVAHPSGTPAPTAALAASAGVARRRRKPPQRGRLAARLLIVVLALVWLLPFVILTMTSLRSPADFLTRGALSVPHSWTLGNFRSAWDVGQIETAYKNSFLVTFVKVPVGIALSAPLAWSLAKLNLRLRGPILFVVLVGLTVPVFIAIVPIFSLLRQLGLIDSIWGLLPPYIAFGVPFEVLVLQAFFRRIPNDLIEAARIDGASELRIFLRIVIPLSVPVLATVFILDAVSTWNEFFIAVTLLSSDAHRTMPLALLNFQTQFTTDFTSLCAGIVLAILPVLLLYVLLQRWIISGLTAGAIKG